MATLSFRVSEQQAQALRESTRQMGITQSQLLRDALRRYLIRLRAEHDIAAWNAKPLTEEEKNLRGNRGLGPGRGLVRLGRREVSPRPGRRRRWLRFPATPA